MQKISVVSLKKDPLMKTAFSPSLQNLLYAVILIIVGTIFYLLRPIYSYTPHGIFLSADPTLVASTKVLGNISARTHFDTTKPEEIDSILLAQNAFVQNLALAHGASTVEITVAGRTPGAPNPLDGVMMNATALTQ